MPVDTVGHVYRKEFYQSNAKGEFVIPAYRKILFFPYWFEWQDILVFAHGYKWDTIRAPGKRAASLRPEGTLIRLTPLKTDKEWRDYIDPAWDRSSPPLSSEVPQGVDFLVKERELFVTKFPDSPLAPRAMLQNADFYLGKSDIQKYRELAIEQYGKVVEKFPESKEASEAKSSIQYIQMNPVEKVD